MAEPYEGIPAEDRAGVQQLNEVSQGIHRAVEAVKFEPGHLAGAFAAGSYPVSALEDIVRVALRVAVPDVLDALGHAHRALHHLLASSESEVDKLTEQRDRAIQEAEHIGHARHMHWQVAQRLREALALAMAQRDNSEEGMRLLAEGMDKIRAAAGVQPDLELPDLVDTVRGMQDRIDELRGQSEAEVGAAVWREGDVEPTPGDVPMPRVRDRYGVEWVADERGLDGFEGWRSDSHGFVYEWRTWGQLTFHRGPVAEVAALRAGEST